MVDQATGEEIGAGAPSNDIDRRLAKERGYRVGHEYRLEIKASRNAAFHRLAHVIVLAAVLPEIRTIPVKVAQSLAFHSMEEEDFAAFFKGITAWIGDRYAHVMLDDVRADYWRMVNGGQQGSMSLVKLDERYSWGRRESQLLGSPKPVAREREYNQLPLIVEAHPVCLSQKVLGSYNVFVKFIQQSLGWREEIRIILDLNTKHVSGLLSVTSASSHYVDQAPIGKIVERCVSQGLGQIIKIGKICSDGIPCFFPFFQVGVVHQNCSCSKSDRADRDTYSLGQFATVLLKREPTRKADGHDRENRLRPSGPDFWLHPCPVQMEAKLMHISPFSWGQA